MEKSNHKLSCILQTNTKLHEINAMPVWLTELISTLTSPGFTAITNLTGVLAFVLTIFVFFSVRQISSHYGALIRLPELKASLAAQASRIGELLSDFENERDSASLELAKLLPMLASVKKRMAFSQRHTVNSLIEDVKSCQRTTAFTSNQVRQIFNHLHTLVAELEQWENDIRWRS